MSFSIFTRKFIYILKLLLGFCVGWKKNKQASRLAARKKKNNKVEEEEEMREKQWKSIFRMGSRFM